MILFNNGYFKLDYDPSIDTLFVVLPYMQEVGFSQAELCFDIMVDHVNNYNIHYLLLDSTKAVVDVEEPEYNRLIFKVSMQLKKTNLSKVARLVSSISKLEEMATNIQKKVLQSSPQTYLIQNFTSKDLALNWLIGESLNS